MTTVKLTALDDNRTYSFFLISKTPALVSIEMYNTPYTFIPKEDNWINHVSNKMEMAPHLIKAVLAAI